MLPFAVPYPPEQPHGFWGTPTSTIDWCEENYVVLRYIAEAVNTVTNLLFIALASYAIHTAWHARLEPRFLFTAGGFMLVGIGLWLFHMTLRYQFQLLDELPMIYATCIPFWSIFGEFKDKGGRLSVAVGIFMAANLLTAVYLHLKDPTIHQAAYGLLNAAIIFKSVQITNSHVHDAVAKANLRKTMYLGISIFLLGYVLWNLDIHLCDLVRATRRRWGMPYGFVLEGHGWWHIFTGTGVYYYLVYIEYLRCFTTGTEAFYAFRWVRGLPVVELVDAPGLDRFRAVRDLKRLDEAEAAADAESKKNI